MSAQTPVPKDSALMQAWEEWSQSEVAENARKWLKTGSPTDGDGELWRAFSDGWAAAGGADPFATPTEGAATDVEEAIAREIRHAILEDRSFRDGPPKPTDERLAPYVKRILATRSPVAASPAVERLREALADAVLCMIDQTHAYDRCKRCGGTWWARVVNPERPRHRFDCPVPGWAALAAPPQEQEGRDG